MATTTDELMALISQARDRGAYATITWDADAATEGREIPAAITVRHLDGIGSRPMSPLFAAERLREALVD